VSRPVAGDSEGRPCFDEAFRTNLESLIAWRRDVRRFSDRPIPDALIDRLLDVAQLSPSVGNSQPWRWVRVESADTRRAIRANFADANQSAQRIQPDERAGLYASLKLEGIDRAPLQYAVYCDRATEQGFGLGVQTMPEMLEYSTVAMITTFWLAARAAGLGVGWVSILDPGRIDALLCVPSSWKFIAYLCVGWPEEDHLDPELERHAWQERTSLGRQVKII